MVPWALEIQPTDGVDIQNQWEKKLPFYSRPIWEMIGGILSKSAENKSEQIKQQIKAFLWDIRMSGEITHNNWVFAHYFEKQMISHEEIQEAIRGFLKMQVIRLYGQLTSDRYQEWIPKFVNDLTKPQKALLWYGLMQWVIWEGPAKKLKFAWELWLDTFIKLYGNIDLVWEVYYNITKK